ncbi:MAG: hypothetical protein MZW92_33540 [Comamonadaceae bacterium]|nr:hypothetical protein [Comamonadaceae bacterium]
MAFDPRLHVVASRRSARTPRSRACRAARLVGQARDPHRQRCSRRRRRRLPAHDRRARARAPEGARARQGLLRAVPSTWSPTTTSSSSTCGCG